MAIKLDQLTLDDLQQIMVLEHQLFEYPFTQEAYEFELGLNQFSHYIKLALEDELIGYGGIQVVFEDAHLMTIGIKKQYQRQGLGRVLLKQLIQMALQLDATRMVLEVNVKNHNAYKLYESLGFKKTRVRHQYYGPDNAYEMVLTLKEEI